MHDLSPKSMRELIRMGEWDGTTTGLCPGYLQANLAILPAELATDFRELCRLNPRPLPLVEMAPPGVPNRLQVAPGADLRSDLSGYQIHRYGELDREVRSIEDIWQDDFVGFVLGCSFTAERRLLEAGVRLRHLELDQGVPMFVTNIECVPAGSLSGPVVVSMRAVDSNQVQCAQEVTSRLPLAHGGPVHIGDPSLIGITDITTPDWGDPLRLGPGDVPVFWACGVTPQSIIRKAKPALAITHAPGDMLITDVRDTALVDVEPPLIA